MGAGRKQWAAYDRLTAQDLNTYLADQVVMSFADAGARDAAIPSPVAGMACYLTTLDQLQLYTAAGWRVYGFPGQATRVVSATKAMTSGGANVFTAWTGATLAFTPTFAGQMWLVGSCFDCTRVDGTPALDARVNLPNATPAAQRCYAAGKVSLAAGAVGLGSTDVWVAAAADVGKLITARLEVAAGANAISLAISSNAVGPTVWVAPVG
jgi:hypothetical protein